MIVIDGRALLERTPGGIPMATMELLRALKDQHSAKMTVVIPTRAPILPDVPIPLARIRRSNRLQLLRHAVRVGEPFDAMVKRCLGFWPSVVFAPTLQPIVTTKFPLVLVIHDCSFFRFPLWMGHKDRWWHRLVRPKSVIESADAIICPSQSTRAELEHFVPTVRERITVIPWGAPVGRGFASPAEAKPRVVAIGTKHRRKNPELLLGLKTFLQTMNPPHELVSIDPSHAVKEEEKWRLLFGARALLYPSFYEGFGLPVLEAMAAGVPVIASLSSSMVEILGSAGVLLSPYAPEQWQESLKAVLMDEVLRQSLIGRGRERVSQFSWDRCATEVLGVLRRFI